MKNFYIVFPAVILIISQHCSTLAQSQGPNYSDSLWNNASAGNVAWTNPINAKDSDAIYATCALSTPGTKRSNYLMATHFHFSIPSNAKITGITVQVRGHELASIGAFISSWGKLIKGNIIQTDSINGGSLPYNTDAWKTMGGCANLWNDTSLKYTDVNDSGFGAAYYGILGQYSNTAYIDCIRITVCYSVPLSNQSFVQTSYGIIYPNPSSGMVCFDYQGTYNVKIYDNMLRKVCDKWLNGLQYQNLSYLNNGIYFIQVFGDNYSDYKKIEIIK